MSASVTDRRSFLKTGALAATPLAALAPVAALAGDENGARLARLEDERAIERLQRAFLRRFNGSGGEDCGEFLAGSDAVRLDPGLCAIIEDPAGERRLEFARDGRSASMAMPCRIEIEQGFDGESTFERMARFQRHGHHRHSTDRILISEFVRIGEDWAISRLSLASA